MSIVYFVDVGKCVTKQLKFLVIIEIEHRVLNFFSPVEVFFFNKPVFVFFEDRKKLLKTVSLILFSLLLVLAVRQQVAVNRQISHYMV